MMKKKLYISGTELISRDFGMDMSATVEPVFESCRPFMIDEQYIEEKGSGYLVKNEADLEIVEDE